jgi:hypothetical protein
MLANYVEYYVFSVIEHNNIDNDHRRSKNERFRSSKDL